MSAGDPRAKVYVILGSHACRSGTLMLEHKGIPFESVIMPSGAQRTLPLLGFPGGTVPAIVMDGQRVQTNPAISRFLDELEPDPPLFPADPAMRREVEEAERWGDDVFQMAARRITLAGILHGPETYGAGAGRLGPILWRRPRARAIGVQFACRIFDVSTGTEPGLLEGLPGQLDRIDGWIERGVLNGEQLNAADYMIATSLALILYRRDLRPQIEGRRAIALADRVLPEPVRPDMSCASPPPVAAASAS
jgi:glutathione S-transferase